MADCGGDQCKSRLDQKRKQRQSASEGIIKSKDTMPRGDLPNNGNVWQTTEPVKLENKGTSIIGLLLSDLAVKPNSKGPTSLTSKLHTLSTCYQSMCHNTCTCAYTYTIIAMRGF